MISVKQRTLERFREDELKRKEMFEAINKAAELIFKQTVMNTRPEAVVMNLLIAPTGVDWSDEH